MTKRAISESSINLASKHPSKHPCLQNDTDSDLQSSADTSESPFPHHKILNGQATICNAAETRHFRNSRALIYMFVDISEIKLDKQGRLASCVLRCGICRAAAPQWRWVKGCKSGGSTTNMNSHMDQKHMLIWQNACQIDKAIRAGLDPVDQIPAVSKTQLLGRPDGESFNIDELYGRVTRWIVTANHAFTEVENTEFQEVLTYLEPALEGTMRHSVQQYLGSLPGLMAIACYAQPKPPMVPALQPNHVNDFAQDWKANLPARTSYLPPSNSSKAEITRYLREDLTEMSPLAWWRSNAHRFPKLAAMARDYLCIPARLGHINEFSAQVKM